MGPEGGEEGGTLMAWGTPEEVAAVPESYTGRFLHELVPAEKPKPKRAPRRKVATPA
jgi:excinuclease ABC subunit A